MFQNASFCGLWKAQLSLLHLAVLIHSSQVQMVVLSRDRGEKKKKYLD